jgi:ornithine carbamoyltransferase
LEDRDVTRENLEEVFELARRLKLRADSKRYLEDKHLALVLEKSSTRTRIAFEVAMKRQGGFSTTLDLGGSQLGLRESIADTGRVLERIYDVIAYRGTKQRDLELLAKHSSKPVINALTELCHPTQALADYFTIQEIKNESWNNISIAYVGDGRNNVANSLLTMGAILGVDIRIAAPESLQPDFTLEANALELAAESGAKVLLTDDPIEAVLNADFVYTDVWVSMGESSETWMERINLLRDFQVNSSLLSASKNPSVKFMHCLPALHDVNTEIGKQIAENFGYEQGVEVTDEVFQSKASIVFQQAENRLHTIEALLVLLVSDSFRAAQ